MVFLMGMFTPSMTHTDSVWNGMYGLELLLLKNTFSGKIWSAVANMEKMQNISYIASRFPQLFPLIAKTWERIERIFQFSVLTRKCKLSALKSTYSVAVRYSI